MSVPGGAGGESRSQAAGSQPSPQPEPDRPGRPTPQHQPAQPPTPHAQAQVPPSQPQPQPPQPDQPDQPASQPHAPGPPQPHTQPPQPYQPAQSQPSDTPPHQPHPEAPHGRPHQPPRAAVTVPLGKMLYLCVAALGVINLFLGYVSAGDGDSMNLYKVGVAIYALAPTMFFLAGLVAVREFLPRERAPGALPAMITTAIFVTLVLSAISSDGAGDLQTLFLVFGAVQFVLAWLAYVFDVGIIGARQ